METSIRRSIVLPQVSFNQQILDSASPDPDADMGKFTRKVENLPKTIEVGTDRLSLLPDDLLVRVLSLLSFKEATATSTLSRCWRYLHTFRANLDFDGSKLLRKGERYCTYKLSRKCMRWVYDVVKLNRSSPLEKFRLFFYLEEADSPHIDYWVRFALSRKVESLELMSTLQHEIGEGCYTLNLNKFNHDGLKLMKKLSTHLVNVSGDAVEVLLRNCPLLEQVSVARSPTLLGLEIIKPFPSLRSIEICDCWNLSSVVVCDSNIVSFKYWGWRVNKVVLVNVPLLTEIWMFGNCAERVEDVAEMFSSVLPQLHTFKIGVTYDTNLYNPKFCSLVEMSNLKQLVVDIGLLMVGNNVDLLCLLEYIRACPRLERFVIEEPYWKYNPGKYVEAEATEIRMDTNPHRRIMRAFRQHLKEVKFVGYRGVSSHFKLLKHLVENVVALETLVIDPWGFEEIPGIRSFDCIPRRKYKDQVFARAYALKESCIPLGINVKIL